MNPYRKHREGMLCDLIREIHNYCSSNRGQKNIDLYADVTFYDEDCEELGSLEAHVALEWLANGLYYSDEINLATACKIEVHF